MSLKKPVKPLQPLPAAPDVGDEFRLCDGERFLFDTWAVEHVRIQGTQIDFWSLDLAKSIKDPLYDEPSKRVWKGPFRLTGYMEYAPSAPEAREEGFRTTWASSIWLARKELEEAHAPSPFAGDVIRVWNTPFYKDDGVDGEEVPGSGYYFDIVDADHDGHLFDNSSFVGFRCDIVRRTEFTPERRLTNK
jgi:hypothetical protein